MPPGSVRPPARLRALLARTLGALALAAALAPPGARAQASPYVPNRDPAYADLDALGAAGLTPGQLLGERPFSRMHAARLARAARARADATLPDRLREALERLEAAFAPELAALCDGGSPCAPLPRGARARSVTADATWADSPFRGIPISYDSATAQYLDARINPLLQRDQGRVRVDGATLGAEGVADFVLHRRVAAQLHPRVWVADPRDSGAGGAAADATLFDGYVRALFGNVALEAGRNHVALGHGRGAGPFLSHNPRGLDLVRVSFDRPIRLPWVLSRIGRGTASMLVADMGDDVDTPHSKLIAVQWILQPHPNVELAGTLTNQQGGENSPSATVGERIQDILLLYPQGKGISDKMIGLGAALTLPRAHTRVYLDWLATDDHNIFETQREALTTEAAITAGARFGALGPGGRFDVWIEGHKNGVRPFTHHQFTSGHALDGELIGDPLGPLGRSVAGGIEWRGPRDALTLAAALEWYANLDFYQDILGDGRTAWIRIADHRDEERVRLTAGWRRDPGPGRVGFAIDAGVERHVGFGSLLDFNQMVRAKVDYRF